MEASEIRQIIKTELPELLKGDPEMRDFLDQLYNSRFADKTFTESRFDRIMDELRREREIRQLQFEEDKRKWGENSRKWEEQNRKWDENQAEIREVQRKLADNDVKWHEENAKWKEQNRKWDEHNLKWEEQNRKWDENQAEIREVQRKLAENDVKWHEENLKWEEQNRKWDENNKRLGDMIAEVKKLNDRYRSDIGAIGARCGFKSEKSFCNPLKGILEENFGVKVFNYMEFDHSGEVFGRPDQVELDIIIKNGMLIIVEIKSSISKSEVHTFAKKVDFYEKIHNTRASEVVIISPMVDFRARPLAESLGMKIYSHAMDVPVPEKVGDQDA